ncbi:MAG: FAD-dependent oxidoreductase [Hyphomonadaceae bacterium]
MARTRLFGAMRRALGARPGAISGPRALSRRRFLAMSAALAACTPAKPPGAGAGPQGIGVIGAGAAGLTIAYRLARAGKAVTLYEASDRVGGRMFTRRDFNEDHQFCELGGELVDTNHAALQRLARELDVGIDRLEAPGAGEDLYHIGRRLYAQHDMADAHGRGAFSAIARRIGADQAALLENDEWSARARALDQTSVADYLAELAKDADDWVITLLDIAYAGEYGLPTQAQSALNLIDMIGAAPDAPFAIYGESDEAFRIRGGSSSLTDALAARLGASVTRAMKHALVAIEPAEDGVKLLFDGPDGRIAATHEAAALALPFTKLRTVAGLDTLALSDAKLKAIRELGYGDNSKLIVSTKARPWNDPARAFPAPSNGVFYSDHGFQLVWDTSRGQPGQRGVLTNYLTDQPDQTRAFQALGAGLEALSPAIAESLDLSKRAWMAWARQPWTLGSFASAKVGQYTTLLEETATPALGGRVQFAGEHTSVDFLGYMNGAIESGERAAAALLAR